MRLHIPEKPTGDAQNMPASTWPYPAKDSHSPDTTVSLTGTSLCTYAVEPPCTERYARWCERSGLIQPLLLDLLFLQGLYFETAPVGAVMSLCMAAQIACDHDCCGQL